MEHLKQLETLYDAHGHWKTVHDIRITLSDALALLSCIAAQYPDAFTRTGGKWAFGETMPENLPLELQKPVEILMQIAEAEP